MGNSLFPLNQRSLSPLRRLAGSPFSLAESAGPISSAAVAAAARQRHVSFSRGRFPCRSVYAPRRGRRASLGPEGAPIRQNSKKSNASARPSKSWDAPRRYLCRRRTPRSFDLMAIRSITVPCSALPLHHDLQDRPVRLHHARRADPAHAADGLLRRRAADAVRGPQHNPVQGEIGTHQRGVDRGGQL